MELGSLINKLIQNPKRLFLIDSLGALLTTFFLLGILRPLEHLFGMPQPVLLLLAIPALGFALYSACCYWLVGTRWRPFMRVIAGANFLYCCITASLVVWLLPQLTGLGITYFGLEMVVICVLVYVELRAAV